PFLLILTVLVFVHELGHFWVARRTGVRVEVFSIGFGPELIGFTDRLGTRWKFSALPLGGYVKMFGDSGAASTPGEELRSMTPEERDLAFHHKRLGQRAAIVAAGPIANFLFAIICAAILFMSVGRPFTPPEIGSVLPGSAAERAGLQPGDRFVQLDGSRIDAFEEIQRIVQLSPGEPLAARIKRSDDILEMTLVPERHEETDRFGNIHVVGRLGIARAGLETVRLNPFEAVVASVEHVFVTTGMILKVVGQMISGSRGADEIGGIVRIAHLSGEVSQVGIVAVVNFMIMLSINLGLINLFPIPMLDGGHLLFYAIEGIRGRPLGERAQEYGFRIGFALVIGLMLFATWNDLVYFRVVHLVKQIAS
ncbi:MAG TPA: RIP metalloprotease RseP, partial [Thermomicrobiales bacterium]|nr:RIP metalloprotease RseP [Thermomicrobiales bacterium]